MPLINRFPPWGKQGESPSSGFEYSGGDRVNEKHLNYLWDAVNKFVEDVKQAINDADSDIDTSSDVVHNDTQGGTAGNPHADSASHTDVSDSINSHETDGEHTQLDGDVVDRVEPITSLPGNIYIIQDGDPSPLSNDGDIVIKHN